jgi:RNA polymerase sigma-54 factor
LLAKIEQANARKSTLVSLLRNIISYQKKYLDAQGEEFPRPLPQKQIAAELGIHPSMVCRAIAGRSVELPWGLEIALKELFTPEKKIRSIEKLLMTIIEEEKILLEMSDFPRPYSDQQISQLLKKRFHVAIAPRTVAKYRTLLHIPSIYERK